MDNPDGMDVGHSGRQSRHYPVDVSVGHNRSARDYVGERIAGTEFQSYRRAEAFDSVEVESMDNVGRIDGIAALILLAQGGQRYLIAGIFAAKTLEYEYAPVFLGRQNARKAAPGGVNLPEVVVAVVAGASGASVRRPEISRFLI